MNPFDIKAALLAKHAQHVVLIHFPIALFIAGVIFDFLAQRTKWRALAEVAYLQSARRGDFGGAGSRHGTSSLAISA